MTSKERIKKQQEEEFVVAEANAIVYPWTMVVHLEDARFADAAMMTPIGFVFPAPLAMPPLSRPLHLLQANILKFLRRSGIMG